MCKEKLKVDVRVMKETKSYTEARKRGIDYNEMKQKTHDIGYLQGVSYNPDKLYPNKAKKGQFKDNTIYKEDFVK